MTKQEREAARQQAQMEKAAAKEVRSRHAPALVTLKDDAESLKTPVSRPSGVLNNATPCKQAAKRESGSKQKRPRDGSAADGSAPSKKCALA